MGYLGFLVIILIVFVVGYVAVYNGLIRRRNDVDQALASIDVMLKKRYDLIPNLVAAVGRYMVHERDTLTELTELRTRALAGNVSDVEQADLDRRVSGALGRLMVSAESYPILRSSENFLQLQGALNEVEEQLSAARRSYNAAATEYHNGIETVPGRFLAGSMGLKRRPLFEAAELERAEVDVGALFDRAR